MIFQKYGYTLFDMNTDPMRILTVQEELRTCKVMNRCIDTKALKAEAGSMRPGPRPQWMRMTVS